MIAMIWGWLWGSPRPTTGGAPPPPVTNYLLDGSGNVLVDGSGSRLTNG